VRTSRGPLELHGGIPSHDTISTRQFEAAFRSWTAGLCGPAVEVPAGNPSIALLRHLATRRQGLLHRAAFRAVTISMH
jgi:hypothetical protein